MLLLKLHVNCDGGSDMDRSFTEEGKSDEKFSQIFKEENFCVAENI